MKSNSVQILENPMLHMMGLIFVLSGFMGGSDSLVADTITIKGTEDGSMEIQWVAEPLAPFLRKPVPVNCQLQQSKDLVHWTSLGDLVVQNNPTQNAVGSSVVNVESGAQFFRLRKHLAEEEVGFVREDLSIGQFRNMSLQNRLFSFSIVDGALFENADLSGAHLAGTDGISVNFSRATLLGADMTASILTNSDFRFASLTGATARFATMSDNDFSGSDLRFVDFTGTDLFRCNLEGADLRGAVFSDTDLRLARLHGAKIDHLTLMPEIPLLAWRIVNNGIPNGDLVGVDLSGMVLSGGNLHGADLTGAKLTAVNLEGTDIRRADLSDVQFDLLNMRGARIDDHTVLPDTLRTIWGIVNTEQDDLNLSEIDLTDAILKFGYLRGADLSGSKLVGALLHDADLSHANLRNADLTNALLLGADLSFADLTNATVSRNAFVGARLFKTIMPDGKIAGLE